MYGEREQVGDSIKPFTDYGVECWAAVPDLIAKGVPKTLITKQGSRTISESKIRPWMAPLWGRSEQHDEGFKDRIAPQTKHRGLSPNVSIFHGT